MTARLTVGDIGAWLLKSARPLDAGWATGAELETTRCVRPLGHRRGVALSTIWAATRPSLAERHAA